MEWLLQGWGQVVRRARGEVVVPTDGHVAQGHQGQVQQVHQRWGRRDSYQDRQDPRKREYLTAFLYSDINGLKTKRMYIIKMMDYDEIRFDRGMTNFQMRELINFYTYINKVPRTWKDGKRTLTPSGANKRELERRLRLILAEYEDMI